MTISASSAITKTTYIDSMGLLRLHVQGQAVDLCDHRLAAGLDRREACIARLPARAAVLDAAGLARLEPRGYDHAVADGQALLDVPAAVAHHLVQPLAEREHRRDRQHREHEPF